VFAHAIPTLRKATMILHRLAMFQFVRLRACMGTVELLELTINATAFLAGSVPLAVCPLVMDFAVNMARVVKAGIFMFFAFSLMFIVFF
jgi:hypothetical protein